MNRLRSLRFNGAAAAIVAKVIVMIVKGCIFDNERWTLVCSLWLLKKTSTDECVVEMTLASKVKGEGKDVLPPSINT